MTDVKGVVDTKEKPVVVAVATTAVEVAPVSEKELAPPPHTLKNREMTQKAQEQVEKFSMGLSSTLQACSRATGAFVMPEQFSRRLAKAAQKTAVKVCTLELSGLDPFCLEYDIDKSILVKHAMFHYQRAVFEFVTSVVYGTGMAEARKKAPAGFEPFVIFDFDVKGYKNEDGVCTLVDDSLTYTFRAYILNTADLRKLEREIAAIWSEHTTSWLPRRKQKLVENSIQEEKAIARAHAELETQMVAASVQEQMAKEDDLKNLTESQRNVKALKRLLLRDNPEVTELTKKLNLEKCAFGLEKFRL